MKINEIVKPIAKEAAESCKRTYCERENDGGLWECDSEEECYLAAEFCGKCSSRRTIDEVCKWLDANITRYISGAKYRVAIGQMQNDLREALEDEEPETANP